jgi:hypothetical protein
VSSGLTCWIPTDRAAGAGDGVRSAAMDGRIESVTVYRRGARVRRSIALDGSSSMVKLVGLPLALDDGSVRVRVEGTGARAVAVRMGVDVAPADPSLAPPRDEELRAAEDALAAAGAEVARLESTLARFGTLGAAPRPRPRRGDPPAAPPAEARLSLARLRTAEAERLGEELAAATAEVRKAERRGEELRDRVRRATTARNTHEHELRKHADIHLEGSAEEGARLVFEYLVPGASWSPAYTLWLDENGARVAMRAVVAQRTGEDWKGVRLVLSTADPDRWLELPELAKLRIGRAQPARPKPGYREPPEGARELYEDYDRAFGSPGRGIAKAEPLGGGAMRGVEPMPAAPQPAKSFAPVPAQAAAAAAEAAHERGPDLGRAVAGPPPPAGAPAAWGSPVAAPSRAMMARRDRVAPPGVAVAPPSPQQASPPPPPRFDLDLEAMAFGRLRMCRPDDVRRGELTVIAAAAVYVDDAHIHVDVGVAIRRAIERAAAIAPLPPAYLPPDAPDAFDYAFAADVPADVPSDHAFHVVPVAEHALAAKTHFVAVPREVSHVFRQLAITSTDIAWLAGPADVYETRAGETTYLLTTRMPATAPGAVVRLGLGVEQGIKIARNVTFAEQSAGLLRGRLAFGHDVAIDLANNLARAVAIEVRERIPVKRKDDDEIEIEVGAVDPSWHEWDQEGSMEGGRRWTVDLDAGRAATLRARYTVRISAKQELVGGNRREQ